MSNHFAIATVTAALSRQLLNAAQDAVPSANIRIGPPDAKTATDAKALINLFLYQVTPNAQHRNSHMASRRSDGSLVNRSRVALDLRYVLSFYGDAPKFEPELMAAAVVAAVEDRPLLSRDAITKAVTEANATLAGSDLVDALSTVRITPEIHSLDELSRMWSIFFQVPYALSTSYLCSHVCIDVGDEGAVPLPVATPRVFVAPMSALGIDAIAAAGPVAPITWGSQIVLRGRGLNSSGLTLRIGDHSLTPTAATTPADVTVDLVPATFGGDELPARHHGVQAIQPPPSGAPAHLSRVSEAKVFALQPVVTVNAAGLDNGPPVPPTASGTMKIDFSPKVVKDQVVELFLDERSVDAPLAVRLSAKTPAFFPVTTLEFEYADLKRAVYLVRAQVDGVTSAPGIDSTAGSPTFGEITGPEVDLT